MTAPTNVAPAAPPPVTWRSWLAVAVLALPVFMASTDMSVLFLATPSIAEALAPGSTQMLWILHIDQFLAMGLGLMMGRLGVRIGWRRLLVITTAVYGVASLGAAYSISAEMLIGFRGVLGIAAGAIMPAAISLIREMFVDPRKFSVAFAILMNTFPVGMALGPPIGGLLLEYFWWGAAFLVNVPPAVVLLLSARLLPRTLTDSGERIDLASVLLTLVGVIPVVWGLQEIAQYGVGGGYLVSIAFGLLMVLLFVRRQRRLSRPLLDLKLFTFPAFGFALLVGLLTLMAGPGPDMLFAQHLQTVAGLSPGQAGLLLTIPALSGIAGGMLVPVLTRVMRPAYVIAAGMVVSAIGASTALVGVGAGSVPLAIAGVAVVTGAGGAAFTASSEVVVTSVPDEQAGTATATNDLFVTFGNAMGIALIGSLGLALYRHGVAGVGGLDDGAADSVAAGVQAAQRLTGPDSEAALTVVHDAWTVGVQWGYGVAALVYVATALLAVVTLRRFRSAE